MFDVIVPVGQPRRAERKDSRQLRGCAVHEERSRRTVVSAVLFVTKKTGFGDIVHSPLVMVR
jgi:hypothetical protein